MNWGLKIFLSLGFFMLAIIGAGVYMVSHDSDTLEEDDYYEQGLNYDRAYEKKKNVVELREEPIIHVENDTLYIAFQSDKNSGELIFRKPSDRNQDKTLPFQTATNRFQLPISSFEEGLWNVYIDWSSGSKSFLFEKDIRF